MRKVQVVAYRFPPQGGGGVQRTLKFTKYLREFGWEPVIQTARNPYWPVWDETLIDDIPAGVRVYRTPCFEFERLEHRLAARLGSREGDGNRSATPNGPTATRSSARRGLVQKLRGAVHRRLLVPDAQVAWVPGAVVHGLKIARREKVSLLYTTSPPNSVQLVGAMLATALGVPWVADFRDPWTDGPRRRLAYVGNRFRERLEQAAERTVLRRATRVVVSAEPLRARFLAKYPFLSPDRVQVVTNGFDPADFAASADGPRELEAGRFHVTGTGNIEAMFDLRPFLQAIAELLVEHPGLRAELCVTLVGARQGRYDADLRALGLSDRVRYVGWVPHAQSLRYLQQSDVLLMCQLPHAGGGAEKLSGKCFEYLYLRKPVLCLTVPGLTADLLAESGLGTVVQPSDVAGIKTALRTLYGRRAQPLRGDGAFIGRFDRRRLTQRLATVFDELTGGQAPASAAA